jgi:hypothetical protein
MRSVNAQSHETPSELKAPADVLVEALKAQGLKFSETDFFRERFIAHHTAELGNEEEPAND